MILKKPFAVTFVVAAIFVGSELPAQTEDSGYSTQDLSFLVGSWSVRRVYSPGSDRERDIEGTLDCREALSGTYVFCRYEFARANARPVIDDVYYNHNPIYDRFESVWMSATWPIKVIMAGNLDTNDSVSVLKTSAEFPIENGVVEYVRGKLSVSREAPAPASFTRNTHIRTSDYEEGVWHHHMIETATRNR